MEEEISNSSLNFVNPSEIELGNSIVELSRRQTCLLYSARWNSRRYVLKTLRPEYAANPVYIEALRKEFELGVRLDHPDIIRVVAFEEIATLGKCIVMEWIDGEPLNKFLSTSPPYRERRAIALRLAEALAYMHHTGVSHRDLKPDNILITHRGHNVKIIDFGLGDADSFTSLKSSRGTQSYGAPETLHAASVADSAADVYSFGKILQQLLPKIQFHRLINRCLQVDPSKRPTMDDVASSLASKRLRNISLALLGAAIAAGIAGLIISNRRPTSTTPLPEMQTRIDTVYLSQPIPADSSAAIMPQPVAANNPIAQPEPTVIKPVDDNRLDSVFKVYMKESEANVADVKEKLRQTTSLDEANDHMQKYSENMISIADKMCSELRTFGYSDYNINSARTALFVYMGDIANELTEIILNITNNELSAGKQ
ncbi:MAG: serine/threonine protein kinase [Barnesiella sp.]|nr:serine/threonine protein kinase [Barnesiella sp.]